MYIIITVILVMSNTLPDKQRKSTQSPHHSTPHSNFVNFKRISKLSPLRRLVIHIVKSVKSLPGIQKKLYSLSCHQNLLICEQQRTVDQLADVTPMPANYRGRSLLRRLLDVGSSPPFHLSPLLFLASPHIYTHV